MIDATMANFGGRFLVNGDPCHALEGAWTGDLIVIEFPSMEHASNWYESEEYAKIRALRIKNTEGVLFLAQGVPVSYLATDILGYPMQIKVRGLNINFSLDLSEYANFTPDLIKTFIEAQLQRIR